MTNSHVGVMLMTYGSPATLEEIPTYLKNVRGGRQPDEELITEFRRRYALIGGSPLLRITREQAAALQDELSRQHPDGPLFHVVAGMRFAPPFIADPFRTLRSGDVVSHSAPAKAPRWAVRNERSDFGRFGLRQQQ